MIMIMKKYNSPMLNVVSIKESDIIATSDLGKGAKWQSGDAILAPGQRGLDDWDAGY